MHFEKRRPTTFGMMLKQYRELKGLSVDRIAYEIGVDAQTVEHIEANRREMPPLLYSPWGDALSIPPCQLIVLKLNCDARKICLDGCLPYLFKMSVEETTYNEDAMAQAARLSYREDLQDNLTGDGPWHGR